MAGTADGPPSGRSVGQPRRDRPPHTQPVDGHRPDAPAERPIALLIGDRIDSRAIARRLEPYFRVIPTGDLATALTTIADRQLDFVVVDAALPDPVMIELVTQIRVNRCLRGLPIICYGSADSGPAVSALAGAAAHEVIIEPVSTSELVARIIAARPRAR